MEEHVSQTGVLVVTRGRAWGGELAAGGGPRLSKGRGGSHKHTAGAGALPWDSLANVALRRDLPGTP